MQTPFRAVSFAKHDIITGDTLDQMQSNLQWMKENTPRGRFFTGDGTPHDGNTVLVCGRRRIKRDKKHDTARVRVRFPARTFAPACHPHVTYGIVSDFQRRIFCVVNGPRGRNYPNADGFDIVVNIAADRNKQDAIKKAFWVHWNAFGYRRDDG